MTKEEIRQEALKAEKELSPRCAGDKENSFHGVNSAYGLGFVDGALWVYDCNKSPWISVDDDLPCNHDSMIREVCKGVDYETNRVLVLLIDGTIEISYMYYWVHHAWRWNTYKVTHWMPLPELPTKE